MVGPLYNRYDYSCYDYYIRVYFHCQFSKNKVSSHRYQPKINLYPLPNQFATDYQGSGGYSNKAGMKIQLEYDLLSGQFLNM
ncbi:hypothetical protein BACI_c32500 [Bacillus cereus biovar anthracis str. CI]|nr:hypothetical protein BACI_c32500 [Bacillus cereus biovar anthracis str. CI]